MSLSQNWIQQWIVLPIGTSGAMNNPSLPLITVLEVVFNSYHFAWSFLILLFTNKSKRIPGPSTVNYSVAQICVLAITTFTILNFSLPM